MSEIDIPKVLAALEAAQDIAVKAIHTPPISDPRWAQIADAIDSLHDVDCSIRDAGECNCGAKP